MTDRNLREIAQYIRLKAGSNPIALALADGLDPAPQNNLRNFVRPRGKRVPEHGL